ncbi:hypothetical protein [Methanocaldococcus sp.]
MDWGSTGVIADNESAMRFTSPLKLEEGKYYKIYGIFKNGKVKILPIKIKDEELPMEVEPFEVVDDVPAVTVVLQIHDVYIQHICKECDSICKVKITKRGVIYECPNCGEIDDEGIDIKVKVIGRMHSCGKTRKFVTKALHQIMDVDALLEEGIDKLKQEVMDKLHLKSVNVEYIESPEHNNVVIYNIYPLY